MPSDEEKIFFRRAFRLIDCQKRTRWYDIYNFSVSQSPDGRIDWGLIPGLISEHYSGYGYIKAVNRVIEILLEIIEDDPNDPRLQQKLRPLALLANAIYEIRREELLAHGDEEIGVLDHVEIGISGHAVACTTWKDASDVLGQMNQLNEPSPIIKTARRALFAIGIAITSCAGVWYLINQFHE